MPGTITIRVPDGVTPTDVHIRVLPDGSYLIAKRPADLTEDEYRRLRDTVVRRRLSGSGGGHTAPRKTEDIIYAS